jgi:hypothetical protein
MKHNINALVQWMKLASNKEIDLLAKKVKCDRHYLYLLKTGIRGMTPDYAMRIEKATTEINETHPHLPIIRQPQICHVCSNCPYTK